MSDAIAWPHGFGDWYDVALLLMLALFKFDRGCTMWRRSGFIDRLGASFIASDFAIGLAYGVALTWTLYPPLADEWARWVVRTVLSVVLGYAWVQMRLARPARVQRVMGDG